MDSVNEVRLQPRSDAGQLCLDFRLSVQPHAEVRSYTDWLGNIVHTFDIEAEHTALHITAQSRLITRPEWFPVSVEALPDLYVPLTAQDAGEQIDFLQPTARADFHPTLVTFVEDVRAQRAEWNLGPLVWAVCTTLHSLLEYVPGATDVGTVASDALRDRRGVCQDYTHILLAALRLLGIPARYTSGYFSPDGANGEVGELASHAWVEAWFPESRWVGFDPTNNRLVNERYIRVAYGRDYMDVSPVKGTYRGAETGKLDVVVSVDAGAN